MRAVPLKVVCRLGLKDADYPRTVQPIGFDLVPYSKRQKGDRSRKLDDRYLFLEAILSARENLYISYIGRSCFDNQPRMPSTLVSELLEYIARSFEFADQDTHLKLPEALINYQHLQPFNPAYYLTTNKEGNKSQTGGEQKENKLLVTQLHSYNPVWMPTQAVNPEPQQALSVQPESSVELTQFIRSICQPHESLYQQSLGLRLPQFNDIAKDEEPLSVDALRRYFYLDEILEASIQ